MSAYTVETYTDKDGETWHRVRRGAWRDGIEYRSKLEADIRRAYLAATPDYTA